MASPWGGDKGGGRKNPRKPGGQPGNTSRRGSLVLPKASDAEERRKFLDAYEDAQRHTLTEKLQTLLDLAFCKATLWAEAIGVQRLAQLIETLDKFRRTDAELDERGKAKQREALKDAVIGDIWEAVKDCEHCSQLIDRRLSALEIELKQL
ncbi:MAG: hypothetical protein AB1757_21265 [Acidobacteriota bacterium]